MSDKIKVSVIVPVYNVEKFLVECINSLIEQTLSEIEILLIDDGSTDKSGKICDDYAKKYSNIKVYHKKNGGLSDARNYGLQFAKGEFISFIDSDDKIAPNMLELMYNTCREEKTKLGICNFTLWFPSQNKKIFVKDLSPVQIYDKPCLYYNSLALNRCYHNMACRKLFHKSLFKKLQFPKGLYHEDIGAWYETMALVERISIITECLYIYRKDNTNSISKNLKNEELRKDHFLQSFDFGYKKIKQFASEERQTELLTALLDGFLRLPYPSKRKEWKKKQIEFLKKLSPYYKFLPKDSKKIFISEMIKDISKVQKKCSFLLMPFKYFCNILIKIVFIPIVWFFKYFENLFSLLYHLILIIIKWVRLCFLIK